MTVLWSCLKRNSLVLFDEVASADVIPLLNNVQLFRDKEIVRDDFVSSANRKAFKMTTEKYRTINMNRTVWLNHVFERTIDVLSTHKLRMNLNANEIKGNHGKCD